MHVPPFSSGCILLRNKANYDNPETTDTLRTDKDDTSCNNRDDSIENVKAMKKMMMKNTKRIIFNINTVMKLLLKKTRKKKH